MTSSFELSGIIGMSSLPVNPWSCSASLSKRRRRATTTIRRRSATALARALANRPEFEAAHQQLASDELIVRLAHNSLKPDLELSGFYLGNGVAGNQFNTANPPQLIGKTGLGDSLSQTFHFTYPAYGAALSLTLPVKNHSA